jgi:hypothetical protein
VFSVYGFGFMVVSGFGFMVVSIGKFRVGSKFWF